MRGISRWTDKGGSYRTIQRFFATALPWTRMLVKFFETHLLDQNSDYILAGDETVVSKSGTETFGVDRLFSGRFGKVIKGLGFFVFSLVSVSERRIVSVGGQTDGAKRGGKSGDRAQKKAAVDRAKGKETGQAGQTRTQSG